MLELQNYIKNRAPRKVQKRFIYLTRFIYLARVIYLTK